MVPDQDHARAEQRGAGARGEHEHGKREQERLVDVALVCHGVEGWRVRLCRVARTSV